jgi:hypothetical protein
MTILYVATVQQDIIIVPSGAPVVSLSVREAGKKRKKLNKTDKLTLTILTHIELQDSIVANCKVENVGCLSLTILLIQIENHIKQVIP